MAFWRTFLAAAACVVAAAACGEAAGDNPPQSPALTPLIFELGIRDSGQVLRLSPGDEVVPRLPLTGLQDQGWTLTVPPNPAVLKGGADLRFFPSEIDQAGAAYHEFSFRAVGPGRTTFTLVHGYQEFRITVQVSPAG